ncbi:hypothetical protein K6V26_11130 [Parabacteroides goldsteinii]|uniref:hypothetical protein n=1 Tax=Parabacteroides goldsteinii TaxID=328812 RepID=UPI001CCA14FC|nr:hypothetical protein [Parabacteroides goldsteinii]UBD76829.1 hypothetical protein K6V26_11130 [Parabacteroides goldsteinii]
MEKLQKAEDLLLSLNNRLDQLAVISKADPAYRLEREEIQQEMRALYEELSGEKLEGEVQDATIQNSADMQDKGLLGVLTGTVDLMKNLLRIFLYNHFVRRLKRF